MSTSNPFRRKIIAEERDRSSRSSLEGTGPPTLLSGDGMSDIPNCASTCGKMKSEIKKEISKESVREKENSGVWGMGSGVDKV